jgi:hypothetical protein
MGEINGRAGRTRREEAKNYRLIFFNGTKKIVIGQSQNAYFSCFKSIPAYPHFGQARKMLLNVA